MCVLSVPSDAVYIMASGSPIRVVAVDKRTLTKIWWTFTIGVGNQAGEVSAQATAQSVRVGQDGAVYLSVTDKNATGFPIDRKLRNTPL